MSWVDILKDEDVKDPETFAQYVEQKTGTPQARKQDIMILRRHLKIFFKANPTATYQTLVQVVKWTQMKRRRFAHVYELVGQYRAAWADGAIHEVDQRESYLRQEIKAALAVEMDPDWRLLLIGAEGLDARKRAYESWMLERAS